MDILALIAAAFALIVFVGGLVFLFLHLRENMRRQDYVLPLGKMASPLDRSGLHSSSGISGRFTNGDSSLTSSKIFCLNRPGGIGPEVRFALAVVIIATVVVGIGGGGLTVEYFFRKAHLATLEILVGYGAAATLFFAVLFFFAIKAIQHFLTILRLARKTAGKEVIFESDRVLFSVGLVYSNHQDQLIKKGLPYIEVPYSSVSEVRIYNSTVTNRRTLSPRIAFTLAGKEEPITILRYELDKHEQPIIDELRARIPKPFILVDHLEKEIL